MSHDPDDLRAKVQRGTFERERVEELEAEEEAAAELAVPGVANSEMEQAAGAARLKSGAKGLSAEALAELTQPWGVSRYVSGGDDEDEAPRAAATALFDEDGEGGQGSLDAPLWHGIAAAPPPAARPPGFPSGSKWVKSA